MITEAFKIAKRENNNKRGFLLVNPCLGKHVPVDPKDVFATFERCAFETVTEPDLVIGFAETATALGNHLAEAYTAKYIQTTREKLPDTKEYIYFAEEHSHATAQYISKDEFEKYIDSVHHIMFVDDEITTGNTIRNAINAIEKIYGKRFTYSVMSILNSMTNEQRQNFPASIHYSLRLDCSEFANIANQYQSDDNQYIVCTDNTMPEKTEDFQYNTTTLDIGLKSPRKLVNINNAAYEYQYKQFADVMQEKFGHKMNGTVLVLGTEEFMYPGLKFARQVRRMPYSVVRFHATTRSPIMVCKDTNYPLHTRYELNSFYEEGRRTFIYDLAQYDHVFVITEDKYAANFDSGMASLLNALKMAGNKDIEIVRVKTQISLSPMRTSYKDEDVTVLLKDITGMVEPEETIEREKKIQSGTHYCEMLPKEYVPSPEYNKIFNEMLELYSESVAAAVAEVSEKIYSCTRNPALASQPVLVSLARAGTPAGILIKHYLYKKYHIDMPHYSISIIRGRGIDTVALKAIARCHGPNNLIFVDGWTGKGAIKNQLDKALNDPDVQYSAPLAVIADPAHVADLAGTKDDLMIPSACLNSTVSGLFSRTFLRDDIIKKNDFHGAVYYGEMAEVDRSYDFINAVEAHFPLENTTGMEDVEDIMKEYNITDVNLVKPGIGETTRVLLRRVPDVIIIDKSVEGNKDIQPIVRLAYEKNVPIVYRPLKHYKVCGIIKQMADA